MGGGDLSSRGGDDMAERDVGPTMTSLQQQPLPLIPNLHNSRPCNSATNSSSNNARGANLAKLDTPDAFPAGMRVLVVDDDPVCLVLLEKMLCKCSYRVTTCGRATDALCLLRGDINKFDLVISDVYMPDMDGFKLLELVGLEMDLPVIMMSGNGETSAVMKGITHGACDYLLKPVRLEELRNIWQHVVRKKRQEVKIARETKSIEEGGVCVREKRTGPDDADYTSSATGDTADGNWRKKRRGENQAFKDETEEDVEQENDDPSTMKKPRVVWSVELHQQFVSAVNQLGIDRAVPKRILELMGVHGLTRENVASHLQKYRLYLKRISGVSNQQSGMSAHFGGPDPFSMLSPDMSVSIANGQLAQFHMLGRMNSSNGVGFSGGMDPMLSHPIFMQDLPRPHLNTMLKRNPSMLSPLPNGLPQLEPQLSETHQSHHLPVMNELEDFPTNTKAFPQLNGNLDVSIASLGVGNGGLGSNPSNDTLLIHMLQLRAAQQGSALSSNLPQPRGGLTPAHLLPNDINYASVGALPNLAGNLTPAVGLSAITGTGGARDLSPSAGGSGSSLSSPLGPLVRRPLMAEEPSNLVNFSMAPSVQSPNPGGGPAVNEGLDQQPAMWGLYNPLTQLNPGHSQGLSQDTFPWPGMAVNLGLGDSQSLGTGLSSQFSPQGQEHGIGFASPGQGSYNRQNVSFPVSSALDGRMVRSSYEP